MRDAFGHHPAPDIRASRELLDPDGRRLYDDFWREPEPESERPTRPSRLPLVTAIVAVVLGVMALIGLREKIVRIAPQASAFYSAVGLKVNVVGLDLRGVSSRIVAEGSRNVLTVEGEIVNLRRVPNRVPPVTLAVRGADGQTRYVWTAKAPKTKLEAGETATFRARLASPPADGSDVLVRFAGLDADRR